MKCSACENDVRYVMSFGTHDESLCRQCYEAGVVWAAKQARTPDPRSQVEKLTPKAGDLIVLRVPECDLQQTFKAAE